MFTSRVGLASATGFSVTIPSSETIPLIEIVFWRPRDYTKELFYSFGAAVSAA